MFIELVDALRCPVPHEDSWLVASAERTESRHIVTGTLGCPVCRAQFPIRRGVADLRLKRGEPDAASGSAPLAASELAPGDPTRAHPGAAPISAGPGTMAPGTDEGVRLAAFLGLDDAVGVAVLCGRWGLHAHALRELVELPLLLVDPPARFSGEPGISVIRCDGPLPLAPAVARGMALDEGTDAARIASAVRATREGGRMVGPVTLPVPVSMRELARDDRVWVAERERELPLVSLASRRRAGP